MTDEVKFLTTLGLLLAIVVFYKIRTWIMNRGDDDE